MPTQFSECGNIRFVIEFCAVQSDYQGNIGCQCAQERGDSSIVRMDDIRVERLESSAKPEPFPGKSIRMRAGLQIERLDRQSCLRNRLRLPLRKDHRNALFFPGDDVQNSGVI